MSVKNGKKSYPRLFVWGTVDTPFIIILFALLTFGLIICYSASIPSSINEKNGDASAMFMHQLIITVGSIVAMFIVSQVNTYYIKLLTVPAYAVAFILLVAVLFIPDPVYPGFHRWIRYGSLNIQPSEIMKFALILILALFIEKYHSRIIGKKNSDGQIAEAIRKKTGTNFYIPEWLYPTVVCGLLIVVPSLLVKLGNHNSGMIILMMLGVVMLFLGDFHKGWFITAAVVIVSAVAAIFIIYKISPDFIEAIDSKGRILAWLDETYSPTGLRWQVNNSLYAIGSGGFFGVGLGNSVQKYYYIPEPQNDMIFPVLCEECGFFGAAVMLIMFAALVAEGIRIASKARDRFSRYIAAGFVMQVGIQAVMNVAVATDLIPNTGISLPFFSSGGTSMLFLLVSMGVVLSVSREARMIKK